MPHISIFVLDICLCLSRTCFSLGTSFSHSRWLLWAAEVILWSRYDQPWHREEFWSIAIALGVGQLESMELENGLRN